jgi:predicted transposase YbfD/YdcC
VKGAIVTIDAAGCQREIAGKIIAEGGDYDLALKGNQETLYREVVDCVNKHTENEFADLDASKHEEAVKGHGRVDKITYYQMPVPNTLTTKSKWRKLTSIGVAIRLSLKDGKETSDVRYYISSTSVNVRAFAARVRGHWAIETRFTGAWM